MDVLSWPVERIREWIADHRAALRAADAAAARLAALDLEGEEARQRDEMLAEYEGPLERYRYREALDTVERFFGVPTVGAWPALVLGGLAIIAASAVSITWLNTHENQLSLAHDRWLREPDPLRRLPDDPTDGAGWGWVLAGLAGGAGLVFAAQRWGRR